MATKKTLLNEATIRRFMKLAELEPLANPFLESAPPAYVAEEEEPTPEEAEYDAAAFEAGEEAGDLEGDEELELDLGAEEEADLGADAGMQEKVKEFFDAVAEAATEILGVDTEVESEEGEIEDVEAMDAVDVEAEEELEGELDVDVGEPEDMEAELEEGADEELQEDQPYTSKKEKPGEDLRKGAEDRGAEGTKKKTSGKGRGEEEGDDAYVNEDADKVIEEITRRVVNRLLNP